MAGAARIDRGFCRRAAGGVPRLPAEAELERDERLDGALRDDELVGVRERGGAGGERGDHLDAAGERDEPLALDDGLGAGAFGGQARPRRGSPQAARAGGPGRGGAPAGGDQER